MQSRILSPIALSAVCTFGIVCGRLLGDDWPPVEIDRATAKIEAALGDPTTIESYDTPLQDVVDHLQDVHDIRIAIDHRRLEKIAIGADTPITRKLKGVSLQSALCTILSDLDLTYVIRDELLLITTPEHIDEHVYLRIYDVEPLLESGESAEAIVAVIEQFCQQDDLNQTMRNLTAFRNLILLRDSYEAHREVRQLLGMIGRAVNAKPKNPPRIRDRPSLTRTTRAKTPPRGRPNEQRDEHEVRDDPFGGPEDPFGGREDSPVVVVPLIHRNAFDLFRADNEGSDPERKGGNRSIPSEADQIRILDQITEVFEFDEQLTHGQLRNSGKRLFEICNSSSGNSAELYVLLHSAAQVSAAGGDLFGALRAVGELERQFDGDAIALRLYLAQRFAKSSMLSDERNDQLHKVIDLLEEGVKKKQYNGVIDTAFALIENGLSHQRLGSLLREARELNHAASTRSTPPQ